MAIRVAVQFEALMTRESMTIETERDGDICILRLSGRFAAGADPEYVRAKSDEIRSLNCGRVLADLSKVTAMGSNGIGFVVGIYSSVTKNPGGRFVMVGAAPRVREVFDMMHLIGVIPSASDIPSGMAMLHDSAPAAGSGN
jgi:anti-anti-sigma factor